MVSWRHSPPAPARSEVRGNLLSYSIVGGDTGVEARVELPSRNPYKAAWLVVRAPGGKRIRSVEIDGNAWSDFDPAQERIRLLAKSGAMKASIHF